MSADQVAELQKRGWVRSTLEGMWEHPSASAGRSASRGLELSSAKAPSRSRSETR